MSAANSPELPAIVGWDKEGNAIFEDDGLDERFKDFYDRLDDLGSNVWLDVDCMVGAIFYQADDLVP